MKTREEIQRAHDILVQVITGEVPNVITEGREFDGSTLEERTVMECCSVLCWVLNHDHNPTFGGNIAAINAALEGLGYKLDAIKPAPLRDRIYELIVNEPPCKAEATLAGLLLALIKTRCNCSDSTAAEILMKKAKIVREKSLEVEKAQPGN